MNDESRQAHTAQTLATQMIAKRGYISSLAFMLYVLITAEDWQEAGDALAIMWAIVW